MAFYANMTEQHFHRLKKGTSPFKKAHKVAIDKALRILNPANEITCIIDYYKVTFPTTDIKSVVEKVLGIPFELGDEQERGTSGYTSAYKFSEIYVAVAPEDEIQGVMLELKGKGCRELEFHLEKQNRSWLDFLNDQRRFQPRIKRIDLAIDDYLGILNNFYLLEKAKKNEYYTPRAITFEYRNQRYQLEHEDGIYGEEYSCSLYFGSSRSERQIVIYRKDIEQSIVKGKETIRIEDLENQIYKNRVELRFKENQAFVVFDHLINEKDIKEIALSILNEYLRFIVPTKNTTDKAEAKKDIMWSAFTKGCEKRLRLSVSARKPSIESNIMWLKSQVAPSIKFYQVNSQYTQTFDDMLEDAKSSPRLESVKKLADMYEIEEREK